MAQYCMLNRIGNNNNKNNNNNKHSAVEDEMKQLEFLCIAVGNAK